MADLEYYGTSLSNAGHYLFNLKNGSFGRNLSRTHELPFNPESLPYAGRNREFNVGVVRFYSFCGFTICAISGSPSDKRSGSKSIFFIEEEQSKEDFEKLLKENELVQQIIKQMPFDVKW